MYKNQVDLCVWGEVEGACVKKILSNSKAAARVPTTYMYSEL